MAIYVYNTSTGALVSYCPNDTDPVAPAAVLQAAGLTAQPGLPPLDSTHQWDPVSKGVLTVAATPSPSWIPTYNFMLCFTSPEAAAITASTDAKVARWLLAVKTVQQVNLNDPLVQTGVNYLASVNLITAARVPQILAGQVQAS